MEVLHHKRVKRNKRSAFAVTDTFLRLNGFYLNLTDEGAYDLVMQVARGIITKEEICTEFELCIVKF